MKPSEKYSPSEYINFFIIVALVILVTVFHFSTQQSLYCYHTFFRELYLLPILLGAFWYGVRGGLMISVGISILCLPVVIMYWQGFSPEDLAKSFEIIFFNVVALILGALSDRERKRERKRKEAILAMAGSITHELNSPLQVVLGHSQLLQDDFEPESKTYRELQTIVNNTKSIRKIVRKISFLDQSTM